MENEISFDVFHGELKHDAAQIYVRVPGLPGGQQWSIRGMLRGPECRYAKTLPIHVPLVDCGAGPTLLARGLLTEPCFWSTELPMIYRLRVEIRRDGQIVARHEQDLGLRFLGIRKRSFYWLGQRWVMRGIFHEEVPETPVTKWKEHVAAMVIAEPSDELCREASLDGVLIVARIGGRATQIEDGLRRLARWPAVGLVLIEGFAGESNAFRRVAPNLLLASRLSEQPTLSGDVLVVGYDELQTVPREFLESHPIVVHRSTRRAASLEEARQQCDVLQRDVAWLGDFAGYVV